MMHPRTRHYLKEALIFSIMVVCMLAARSSFADHYLVPSGSMEYTLIPGDHVLVDKMAYGLRLPFSNIKLSTGDAVRRGEVVIFDEPGSGTRLIKRAVAIGGDLVSLRDGWLTINGEPLATGDNATTEAFGDHIARLNLSYGGGPDIRAGRVPAGMVLVIGDARGNSRDGRYFGLIPEREIYGKAISVVYRADEGLVWKSL